MMMVCNRFTMKNLSLAVLLLSLADTYALVSEQAGVTRSRLFEAFASPSGKLSLAPELVIPEPLDSTAILLQANAIQTLSGRIRSCKANAALVQGSVTALKTFSVEQELSRGEFPGPVPVVYGCPSGTELDLSAIAEAGADGVLVSVCNGEEIKSIGEITENKEWIEACQQAWECGVQPIPEVTVGQAVAGKWTEDDVTSLVESISSELGADPVSVVFTVNPADEEQEEPVDLPKVPKALGKRIPVLGSVRITAGENRLSAESARFKECGFTGTLLRTECLPGVRLQLDLEIVGKFWGACINELKSTKSKNFSFRSKNNLETSAGTKWFNYQSEMMASGALGDPEESSSVMDMDDDSGDYQGF